MCCIQSNSTIIASCSVDDTIHLCDADMGEERDVLGRHESDVVDIAFSPIGDLWNTMISMV